MKTRLRDFLLTKKININYVHISFNYVPNKNSNQLNSIRLKTTFFVCFLVNINTIYLNYIYLIIFSG